MGSTLKYLSNYATVIPCSWGLSSTFLAPLPGSVALKLLFLFALDIRFTFSFASCISFIFSLLHILQSPKLGEVYFFDLLVCDILFSLVSVLHCSLVFFQFCIYLFLISKTHKNWKKNTIK